MGNIVLELEASRANLRSAQQTIAELTDNSTKQQTSLTQMEAKSAQMEAKSAQIQLAQKATEAELRNQISELKSRSVHFNLKGLIVRSEHKFQRDISCWGILAGILLFIQCW